VPSGIGLTVPEVRRLLVALAEPPERWRFRLAWSHWRRQHQAVARRCHRARRARTRAPTVRPDPVATPAVVDPGAVPIAVPQSSDLTDAQWAALVPLLPARQPHRGRPPHDQRPIVAGMRWIARTGASWRQLPIRFGSWQTVYGRYRRWRNAGIWQRIVDAQQQQDGAATSSVTTTAATSPPTVGS
jgi:transposase